MEGISPIKNLKNIQARRGESLTIDLGKEYTGTLTSWMKKDLLKSEYVEFDIIDNRYLYLVKSKTQDDYDGVNKTMGRWYFDVRQLPIGGTEDDEKTIFTGSIFFKNNITNFII